MKISFITTVRHNVGDDFIREGLKFLLKKYFKDEQITFENIHKHAPITARKSFESYRNKRLSLIMDKLLPLSWTEDRIMGADVVIQSGAPYIWCHENSHCFNSEWYEPLLKRRFNPDKTLFLNLAAGSCLKYHSDGSDICSECKAYLSELFEMSALTTLRDTLAKNILMSMNLYAEAIPCSSIFAIDEFNITDQGEEYVVMNYMPGGAHYTLGQYIDADKWERSFKAFYNKIKKNHQVVMACHNKKELDAALSIDPKANTFYSDDFVDYLNLYSKTKVGIMNRVHGAFAIASFGKPAFIIGNDTRARMGEEINVESAFVNDVDTESLLNKFNSLLQDKENIRSKFLQIKKDAYRDYMTSFDSVFKKTKPAKKVVDQK